MRLIRSVRVGGLVWSLAVVVAAVSGCETKVINIQVTGSNSFVVQGTIGQNGGSLSVDSPANPAYGTEVTVPAGAVAQNMVMTIQPASAPPAPPYGVRGVGPVVQIDFATLTTPAQVKLPFTIDARPDERLVILRRSLSATATMAAGGGGKSGGSWEVLDATMTGDDTRRVQASSDSFGLFVVATVTVAQTDGGPDAGPITDGGSLPDTIVAGPDNVPPTFAGLSSVTLTDATHVHLSWKPATDNVSPSSEIRYRLYVPSFGTVGTPKGETRPGETSIDLAVTPGVTYYFLVRAVDRAGNEDSNLRVQNLVTPPAVPDGGPVDGGDAGVDSGVDAGKDALIGPDAHDGGQDGGGTDVVIGPDAPPLLGLGALCDSTTQCQSGFCVDGVCCDGACSGSCSYCRLLGRAGRCAAAPAGTDPRNECQTSVPGRTLVCGQDRTCSWCRATDGTEICNNGVDDNGDGLVDTDDPQCAVCIDRPSTFTLEVATSGTGTGVVTSSPPGIDCGATCRASFADGAQVVLTAVPDDTSTFAGWAGDCAGQPGTTCLVTTDQARTVTAGFTLKPTPQVTLSVSITGNGTVDGSLGRIACHNGQGSCSADYDQGTHVTLTATPDSGYYFVGWQGGGCAGASSCSLDLLVGGTVTAQFAAIEFALTTRIAGNGSGTVTDATGAILCGAGGTQCGADFIDGTQVTLTATPAAHSRFVGWSGDCAGTSTCTLTISGSALAIATFVPITHVVTVAASGQGTVTDRSNQLSCTSQGGTCSASFNEASTVTLIANPAQGAFFSRWSGACVGQGRLCSLTVNGNLTTTAVFLPVQHQLSVSLLGTGTGQVSDGGAILCGEGQARCSSNYDQGTVVTLTASAAPGNTFTGWSGDCSGTGSCVVALDAARSVGATFTRITHTLTVTVGGTAAGTVTSSAGGISCTSSGGICDATFDEGTRVTLTANPGQGAVFTGWSGGGCEGTAPCLVPIDSDVTVTAAFVPITHNVSVTLTGSGTGTVSDDSGTISCGTSCSGAFNEGSQITLTATAARGSIFNGWTGGGCTGTAPCTITVTGATAVSADFQPATLTLTTSAINSGGVITDDAGQITCGDQQASCSAGYAFGTQVTLTASPDKGFDFVGWGGDCSGTSTCTLTMDVDHSVTATFLSQFTTLTVSVIGPGEVFDDSQSVRCTNDGGSCIVQFARGTQVTLGASVFQGAQFDGWSGACAGTGACVVIMDTDRDVTATFESLPPPVTHTVSVVVTQQASDFVLGDVVDSFQLISCDSSGGTSCSAVYNDGDTVTLTAQPNPNSGLFNGWGGDCASFGTSTTCTLSVFSDLNVSADFLFFAP
jgi:hypothetical protein